MPQKPNEESGLPNAARFVKDFLRGSTYTFSTAMADIVDNSIEAKATSIEIEVNLDANRVVVMDNGVGMSDAIHHEAMKVAAETRDYSDSDLGRYGTGMKSASLSQARRLIVATREKGSDLVTVRCLDVDHVIATNDWDRVTLVLDRSQLPENVKKHFSVSSGTAVIWENLDKVFGDKALPDTKKRAELIKQADLTAQHLSRVFHKFIDGEVPGHKAVKIAVNSDALEPWDPFATSESTIKLAEKDIVIGSNGSKAKVVSWVLPGEKEFSSKDEWTKAKGNKPWNDGQGFYVYRNGRLIAWGGWFGMRSKEPHNTLARVSFEFSSELDEILKVPVDKSSIVLPQVTKILLKPIVEEVSSQANARYRKQKKITPANPSELPGRNTSETTVRRKLTAQAFIESLEKAAATEGLTGELADLKRALKKNNISIADEVGW
jgi:hypothetical protein